MSRKVLSGLAGLAVFTALFFTGCGPQADLALNFSADSTCTYKIHSRAGQNWKFEQPTLEKAAQQQTLTDIQMTFTQKIESVDEAGAALANITVKKLKILIIEKEETKLDFDSAKEGAGKAPIYKLIGQSYKINISPNGTVTVADASAIRAAVKTGYDAKIAKFVFNDKHIIARHEILALPDTETKTLTKGDSWTRLKASPIKLLEQKSFEKIYTLANVKTQDGNQIATVEMNAIESAVPAPDFKKVQGMDFLAKMFDGEETYTGSMMLDLTNAKVIAYNEKLIGEYVIIEENAKQAEDKGPDKLTMGSIYNISIELVQ